jgi:hypothetical protein
MDVAKTYLRLRNADEHLGAVLHIATSTFTPNDGKLANYRVFRAQADWTFILPSEFPAKELRHLPRKMPPRGITY